MPLDPSTVETLSRVSTATLTTVLMKHGLRNVWMRGTRPLRPGQPRIVGEAFTMRFVPAREDLATPASWANPRSTRGAIEDMPAGGDREQQRRRPLLHRVLSESRRVENGFHTSSKREVAHRDQSASDGSLEHGRGQG